MAARYADGCAFDLKTIRVFVLLASDSAGGGRADNASTGAVRGRRRINFDHIQTAIKQLVNEASSDVRAQYGHMLTAGTVNQSLLQRRVASELMVRLARTGTEGSNELNVRRYNVYLFVCVAGRGLFPSRRPAAMFGTLTKYSFAICWSIFAGFGAF